MSALELCHISLKLGQNSLIDSLSLTVPAGEITAVMGESGSGKSTLLAYLCGTLAPAFQADGRVLVGTRDVTELPPEQRQIGILFQDDLLFPHLSVGDNLAFALKATVRDRAERRQCVEQALDDAGLSGFAKRDPATLSGGQRARVSVMRTLLSEPQVLLLDEPFSKLDASNRRQFRQFVFDHARERRLPTLMVTHDPKDAVAAGGPVVDLALILHQRSAETLENVSQ
ncbi:MAG: ATP-binding cassette domain-containing protein [Candidatus Competibacteraceae bacterium]|jgi:putative thiamine transport system ATP-binding protein|nr:ATP-binding cassette domain-containing protein [Candidatus Competibacteraceae bacterium]